MLKRGLPILPSGHFHSPGLLNTGLIAASMGLFDKTEFAARLPGVLFGTLTIPLVYVFARADRGQERLALVAAFLVAFPTLEIAWSREARMYQQLQFFYILSLYFFHVFTQTRSNRYRGVHRGEPDAVLSCGLRTRPDRGGQGLPLGSPKSRNPHRTIPRPVTVMTR